MSENVKAIADVLTRETTIYSEILTLSKEKSEVVAKGTLEELDAIVRKEQILLMQLGECERRRKALAEAYAEKLGKPAAELTLKDMIAHANGEDQAKLEALHGELVGILEEQMQLNEKNHKLIESKLQYINFSVDMLMRNKDGAANNYTASGGERGNDGAKINIIDSKA
ncbi:flagellar protein FlgN [Oscillospiraceae bacterium OttesenSCG-928-F05]|nr:flagellar protein FlgN [Oscillospiraceae bacterium OttesenSCG-928-F05]